MIRNKIYAWKLKKLHRKEPRRRADLLGTLKNTRSALILCVDKNTSIMTLYNDLQEIFKDAQIHTWVYNELNEKQKEGNQGVRKEIAEELAKTGFDFIIDATPYVSEEWLYFVRRLSGKIIAGISKTDTYNVYDLLITFHSGKTTDNGYRMVTEYLKKLAGK